MLTIADGGGVQEPLILADVICEQPLNIFHLVVLGGSHCAVVERVSSEGHTHNVHTASVSSS